MGSSSSKARASEREVVEYLESKGCLVRQGGWPDLLVKNSVGHSFALELKSPTDKLKYNQIDMHHALHDWTRIRVLTRRYTDVEDLPTSEEVGLRTQEEIYDEAYKQGFEDGRERGWLAAVDKFFPKRMYQDGDKLPELPDLRAVGDAA